MRTQRVISIVRCHAEGEVGDVIVGGVLPQYDLAFYTELFRRINVTWKGCVEARSTVTTIARASPPTVLAHTSASSTGSPLFVSTLPRIVAPSSTSHTSPLTSLSVIVIGSYLSRD